MSETREQEQRTGHVGFILTCHALEASRRVVLCSSCAVSQPCPVPGRASSIKAGPQQFWFSACGVCYCALKNQINWKSSSKSREQTVHAWPSPSKFRGWWRPEERCLPWICCCLIYSVLQWLFSGCVRVVCLIDERDNQLCTQAVLLS